MYLMGLQCSGAVQPVFGRSSLFQQQSNGGVFQSNSNSPNSTNELGNVIGNVATNSTNGIVNGNVANNFHHMNASTLGSNLQSPINLHQLSATNLSTNNQNNGLGLNNCSKDLNGKHQNNSNLLRSSSLSNQSNCLAPSLLDYFPNVGNDGLRLTWCHAVNSRARLNHALTSDASMIQADVTLADNSRYPIPIMAQPPLNMSDLTLEDLLLQLIHCESGKGVKFDFKTTRVVEPAFRVLARHADYLKAPLILNADILAGDNTQNAQPVDAWTFLMLCRTRFPKSIISMGWCVNVDKISIETGYSRTMVDQMLSIVKEYSLLQPITFPVNAALVKNSISELQRLLFQVPNSSLTLWANPGDPVTIEDLMLYRKAFVPSQLYYDLPEEFLNLFRFQVYKR